MRARTVYEFYNFQRGIDPKEAMGIGRLSDIPMESIRNAFACVRNYSLEDLENIYRRVKAKSNIKLDGVPVEKLSYNGWVEFNNKIVNGIKSYRRRKSKAEAPFEKGDILKVIYNGRTYFGFYDGIDKHGRLKAKGLGVKLAFWPKDYVKATPEEIEDIREKELIREKNRMKSYIKRVENIVSSGNAGKHHLDSAIEDYEKKFGEKYEG
jgi:hypothetical protein